jgi:hypothetical protein
MASENRNVDEILSRRYWLKQNFDWFMNEVTFHKEMKRNFSGKKLNLWKYGELEAKVKIKDEASFRPE